METQRRWADTRSAVQGLGYNRIAGNATVSDSALRFLRGETVDDPVMTSPNLPCGFA